MSARHLSYLTLLTLVLGGCGTMNSDFSCNATAGDSCLTIEQVDAMTRFADDVRPMPVRGMMKASLEPKPEGRVVRQSNGQSLWVAQKTREQSWA
ncbi:TPA: conjugal transfer protein [Legionella pneumophila]|nr:conjugal transfer protein [Legionella pneumophila]HCU5995186.1 conjugal transfer protein [Legionella pneumophila]